MLLQPISTDIPSTPATPREVKYAQGSIRQQVIEDTDCLQSIRG